MHPWEEVAKRAANAATEASAAARRSDLAVTTVRGLFEQLSTKLDTHVDECRRLRMSRARSHHGHGHDGNGTPSRLHVDEEEVRPPAADIADIEPDDITQHGTRYYILRGSDGREYRVAERDMRNVLATARAGRWAWHWAWRNRRYLWPMLAFLAVTASHVIRTLFEAKILH